MSRRVEFRTKKNSHFGMVTVLILVAMFCSIIGIKSISLRSKRDEYNKRIEALEKQIAKEEERKKDLEEYEKYTKTVKYVEEVAKDKLGLVYEDEIVFESGVEEQ
ncbi:MAG: septum formation initiator family protein [Lachnospiraceae bacterium]|nr:septum formation initiator family protein [Lachnospiraceae bacterium]